MSTYATLADLAAYTPTTLNTTDSNKLQKILDLAEKDVDRLLPRSVLTNSRQGVRLANATGGSFTLALEWFNDTFTSDIVPHDATLAELIAALNVAENSEGMEIPTTSWKIPEVPIDGPAWSEGPFPNKPIVIEATGKIGQQQLPALTVASDNLTPSPAATATVVLFTGGGTRIDIWNIEGEDRLILKNATCAQAVFRDQMGAEFFWKNQYQEVSGPEFRTKGRRSTMGSQVFRELAGSRLIQIQARARLGTPSTQQMDYSPVGGTPIPDDWRSV